MYNELFYDISKRGKNSHTKILEKSALYAGLPPNPKQEEINELREQLEELQDDLDSIEEEHPFFKNGSVIQSRNNSELNYYMHSGRKRQIFDDRVFNIIKKQSGFKNNAPNSDFVIYLNAQAIGEITSGPPINHPDDLHIDILEINRYGQNLNNIINIDDNILRD